MESGVFLQLGSNMGNRAEIVQTAMEHISSTVGNISRQSTWYQTAAWGNTEQPDFLNLVLQITTSLPPAALLAACLNIEQILGRQRTFKNAPRTIDIDILLYGDTVITEANLTIPHPAIQHRRFVLIPMVELAAKRVHPVLKKSFEILLAECKDDLAVKKYSGL